MSEQRQLFETEAPAWEADDAETARVCTVIFPTGPEKPFDYLVPETLRDAVEVGRRVRVPFGAGDRRIMGYCVEVSDRPLGRRRLKPVLEVVDEHRLLTPSMLRLTRWMAEYYLCDWGTVLDAVLPAGVRDAAGTRLTTLLTLAPKIDARLATAKLPTKQLAVIDVLRAAREPLTPKQLANAAGCAQGPITALRRKGLIISETRRLMSEMDELPTAPQTDGHQLNGDQQRGLDAILTALRAREHKTILLHGITGSGKTEVYIRAIQEVVSYGKQAIVLVPEISLTPQTCDRFRARFGRVAVLHSHLSDAERHAHWLQIAQGSVPVVVGARSAIFAPVPHLGIVVLDEEHESTFKQETAPRYHAREVALRRAREDHVPLVLGSATPALESWQRARSGEFELIELPRRVLDRPLPEVLIVDQRHDAQQGRSGAISRQLQHAMQRALGSGGQVILLLNRRGFSTHIQCPACGKPIRCPHCDIALTHHRHDNQARCHYCDYHTAPPRECPSCGGPEIFFGGYGTQRLEADVRAMFRDYTCQRMDTDTMQQPGSHERALARFRSGEVQILLGTQMIAKGLDFPNVTLVGVINADVALHLPDFRAAERTVQLLVQVAGRTGRGEQGGRVMVQTLNPDHPAIRAAARHDYARFAEAELRVRQEHHYPPFAAMARLVARGPADEVVAGFMEHLTERLREAFQAIDSGARILGPAPAPIAKIRGLHRFQIQVQSATHEQLHAGLRAATDELTVPDHVQWIIDIDPLNML
ncbi:MAG: primosomal protein N' [Planctomycetes bacterium]|nr:primosomal protein N' [Planctomycetota bacterium]